MRRNSLILTALFLLFALPLSAADLKDSPLFKQAQKERGARVKYAAQNGAKLAPTPDGKSFYLYWFPEGADRSKVPVLVTMHGHDGWAFDDFQVWHKYLKERGYGFLAVQWWLGQGEAPGDYLTPREMYQTFDEALKKWNVPSGRALLHGFSRGSANIYAVAALDRDSKNDHFALFIANAGKANKGYPPTDEVMDGKFGEKPYAGTKWITYAGGQDPNPDRDGVNGMRQTADWIRQEGGEVVLAIEDPASGHGGFHMNAKNCKAALDEFDKLLRR